MKSILIIVIVVVAMAGAAFFLTAKVIKPRFGPASADGGAHVEKPADDEEHEETPGEVYLVSDLLVNPTGTGGTRYLSATVGLEVPSPEVAAQLEERDVKVRDVLISILSARSVDQLTDFQSREQMRREIQTRLDKMIQPEKLSAVYFVDYVLQ